MEVLVLVPASHYLCTTWDHNQLDPKPHILEATVCDHPSHIHQEVLKVVSSFCHSLYCKHTLCKRNSGKKTVHKNTANLNIWMRIHLRIKLLCMNKYTEKITMTTLMTIESSQIIGYHNWKFVLKCSIESSQ